MRSIKDKIHKIGIEMMKNHPRYHDTVFDPKRGIVPRCLIYEDENRNLSRRGSVIVGINPGQSNEPEREFYKKTGASYPATITYWDDRIKKLRYYVHGRAFVDALKLRGPILWTELVKCESQPGIRELSVQTIRDSINRYLFKELEAIPGDWLLIAVGGEAFKILSYHFPDRIVIGIPHITSARGQFHKLFSKNVINPIEKQQLKKLLRDNKLVATAFKCRNGDCRFDYPQTYSK